MFSFPSGPSSSLDVGRLSYPYHTDSSLATCPRTDHYTQMLHIVAYVLPRLGEVHTYVYYHNFIGSSLEVKITASYIKFPQALADCSLAVPLPILLMVAQNIVYAPAICLVALATNCLTHGCSKWSGKYTHYHALGHSLYTCFSAMGLPIALVFISCRV